MDNERLVVYETFIRDMLNVFSERYEETKRQEGKSEFQQGRELAYWEILDIIKTRKDLISEMLEGED